jgi:hypothetical protein
MGFCLKNILFLLNLNYWDSCKYLFLLFIEKPKLLIKKMFWKRDV